MKFTIMTYNPSKRYFWTMHATGCADIAQELKGHKTDSGFPATDPTVVEAENWKAAAEGWIDEELREMGYNIDAIRIAPCCHKHTFDEMAEKAGIPKDTKFAAFEEDNKPTEYKPTEITCPKCGEYLHRNENILRCLECGYAKREEEVTREKEADEVYCKAHDC